MGSYIWNRLKEPSTHVALAGAAAYLAQNTTGTLQVLAACAAGLLGGSAVLTKEGGSK